MAGNKFAPNPWFVDNRPEIYMGMGLTAERLQQQYGITREEQDAFSLAATQRAERARHSRRASIEEIGPPVERLQPQGRRPARRYLDGGAGKLKPVFHAQGTVTAGNSRRPVDGAAAALVMSESKARELGLKPMARFVSFAAAGVPPEIMGIGPAVAIPKALALAGSSSTTSTLSN